MSTQLASRHTDANEEPFQRGILYVSVTSWGEVKRHYFVQDFKNAVLMSSEEYGRKYAYSPKELTRSAIQPIPGFFGAIIRFLRHFT